MEDTNVRDLLVEMMKIDSTTGHEEAMGEFVASRLEAEGWIITRQFLDNSTRFNVLATRQPLDIATPRLVFNSHLDTVPPYIPPTFDDRNVYGRGSNDAKGQLACMMLAASRLVRSHPALALSVGLLFVVGEEVDHIGMLKANQLPIRPEYLVVGEPTELIFGTLQKGGYKVRLTAKGRAGHSGYPHSGESAIHALVPVLNDILAYDWPKDPVAGDTTVNIGLLSGGQALNAWAAECTAVVFFRVTTSVHDIRTRLALLIKGRAEVDESLGGNDPVTLSSPPAALNAPTAAVAFNTDLPYYDKRDSLKGAFLFGAGSITNAHSEGEFCPIDELEKAIHTHHNLAIQLLQ